MPGANKLGDEQRPFGTAPVRAIGDEMADQTGACEGGFAAPRGAGEQQHRALALTSELVEPPQSLGDAGAAAQEDRRLFGCERAQTDIGALGPTEAEAELRRQRVGKPAFEQVLEAALQPAGLLLLGTLGTLAVGRDRDVACVQLLRDEPLDLAPALPDGSSDSRVGIV